VLKVAVQVLAADIVTEVLGDVPVQSPLQPANTEPALGVAVSVTTVPVGSLCVQLAVQFVPGGAIVTVPLPVPVMLTFKLTSGAVLKVAVQVLAADIVTEVLGDVPVQSPLQPANTEPALGVAVSVTMRPVA